MNKQLSAGISDVDDADLRVIEAERVTGPHARLSCFVLAEVPQILQKCSGVAPRNVQTSALNNLLIKS